MQENLFDIFKIQHNYKLVRFPGFLFCFFVSICKLVLLSYFIHILKKFKVSQIVPGFCL